MESHVNPTDLGRLEDRSLDNRFEIDRTRLESDARRRDNTWSFIVDWVVSSRRDWFA